MPTLTIGNSYSQLADISENDYRHLQQLMSYTVNPQAAYMGGRGKPQRRSLLSKKLEFPTGLTYIVNEYFEGAPLTVRDTRIVPHTHTDAMWTLFLPNSAPKPRSQQLEVPQAVLNDGGRGIVVAPTGSGKSLMIALTIDKFKVRTLIVTPSLELKRQLSENLERWFGVEAFNRYVTVANIDSLDTKSPATGYDMVIVDELHHVAAKSYRDLNKYAWKNVYLRVGFTATPFRSSDDERLLFESFLSQVSYRIEYHTAVENKYIVPLDAFYCDMPSVVVKGNPQSYPAMYAELIVNNDYRNNRIALLMKRLASLHLATLCLVKEIKHGENLASLTGLPFANGQDGRSEQLISDFNSGRIKSLIATVGVCGEGVDTKPAEYVIVAGAGKAKTQFMQVCGRGFRCHDGKESCKVILFKDNAHPWFKKHFKTQCKILLEEYGVTPILLTEY